MDGAMYPILFREVHPVTILPDHRCHDDRHDAATPIQEEGGQGSHEMVLLNGGVAVGGMSSNHMTPPKATPPASNHVTPPLATPPVCFPCIADPEPPDFEENYELFPKAVDAQNQGGISDFVLQQLPVLLPIMQHLSL